MVILQLWSTSHSLVNKDRWKSFSILQQPAELRWKPPLSKCISGVLVKDCHGDTPPECETASDMSSSKFTQNTWLLAWNIIEELPLDKYHVFPFLVDDIAQQAMGKDAVSYHCFEEVSKISTSERHSGPSLRPPATISYLWYNWYLWSWCRHCWILHGWIQDRIPSSHTPRTLVILSSQLFTAAIPNHTLSYHGSVQVSNTQYEVCIASQLVHCQNCILLQCTPDHQSL